jgi:hypothetical protein
MQSFLAHTHSIHLVQISFSVLLAFVGGFICSPLNNPSVLPPPLPPSLSPPHTSSCNFKAICLVCDVQINKGFFAGASKIHHWKKCDCPSDNLHYF